MSVRETKLPSIQDSWGIPKRPPSGSELPQSEVVGDEGGAGISAGRSPGSTGGSGLGKIPQAKRENLKK